MVKIQRNIRMLDWSLRDHENNVWDRVPGWLSREEVTRALGGAEYVVVHFEDSKETRYARDGEPSDLVKHIGVDGQAGDVCGSTYIRGAKRIILLSVQCKL